MDTTINRLNQYLDNYKHWYPDMFFLCNKSRLDKGKNLPDWPDWCYCPLAVSYSIILNTLHKEKLNPEESVDIGNIGALLAWKPTKLIYRYNSELLNSLCKTQITKLPIELFYHLPAWCVYIEADNVNFKWLIPNMLGFFAYMEFDENYKIPELRITIDSTKGLIPLSIELTKDNIFDCLYDTMLITYKNINQLTEVPDSKYLYKLEEMIVPLISTILYLCSEQPDIKPNIPQSSKHQTIKKNHQTKEPKINNVGYRIGYMIINAKQHYNPSNNKNISSTRHASPAPHLRRAHWHLFWTGHRTNPVPKILWLNPIAVGVKHNNNSTIIPKIYKIKKSHTLNK